MINLDFSIVVTILYVLALYFFLSRFFFGPIMSILAERRRAIEGSLENAAHRLEEVERKTREYETAVREARAEAYRLQERMLTEAVEERGNLVAQAKGETEKAAETARVNLASQAKLATQELEREVETLARSLSSTILRD